MPASDSLPVIALVTAFNEESTIGRVVETLRSSRSVDAVQVVDDGSTDRTAEVAREAGARVISLPERIPVGAAIVHHLDTVEDECILMWCDADLVGLSTAHPDRLVDRFRSEKVTMSLSCRGVPPGFPGFLRKGLFRAFWIRMFGPLTGERVILRSDFVAAITLAQKLEWSEMMRGYGIVLFLNWYARKFGNGFVISYFAELRQRQKYEKWGGFSIFEMFGEWKQFALTWIKIRLRAGQICSNAGRLSPSTKERAASST